MAAAAALVAGRIERRSIHLDFPSLRRVLLETSARLASPWTLRHEADTVTTLMPEHIAQFASVAHTAKPA